MNDIIPGQYYACMTTGILALQMIIHLNIKMSILNF